LYNPPPVDWAASKPGCSILVEPSRGGGFVPLPGGAAGWEKSCDSGLDEPAERPLAGASFDFAPPLCVVRVDTWGRPSEGHPPSFCVVPTPRSIPCRLKSPESVTLVFSRTTLAEGHRRLHLMILPLTCSQSAPD